LKKLVKSIVHIFENQLFNNYFQEYDHRVKNNPDLNAKKIIKRAKAFNDIKNIKTL